MSKSSRPQSPLEHLDKENEKLRKQREDQKVEARSGKVTYLKEEVAKRKSSLPKCNKLIGEIMRSIKLCGITERPKLEKRLTELRMKRDTCRKEFIKFKRQLTQYD